jgi:cytosine/adenosine deaminase-related metal-dependent hydrolase
MLPPSAAFGPATDPTTMTDLILRGLELVGDDDGPRDLVLSGDRIVSVAPAAPGGAAAGSMAPALAFHDAIAFPGLYNSHEHLEFNLYPPLGHGPYGDYVDWGADIQRRDGGVIAAIESVPRGCRLRWGALKNLLSGVTSVAHHGEPAGELPIEVLPGKTIHSLRRDGRWRWRLNRPPNRAPYVFHIGEGTTLAARHEIDELIRWNLFRRELIGVHAVAMNPEQAAHFRALVWCPLSNQFLYGQTADVRSLKKCATVLLGTDSTLTASWNLWNHLRGARSLGALADRELFDAVTRSAAAVWGRGTGQIRPGSKADLVVARKKSPDRWEAFFALDPADILLVLRNGNPLLIDRSIPWPPATGWRPASGRSSVVRVGGAEKLVVEDVPALLAVIRRHGLEPNLDLEAAA